MRRHSAIVNAIHKCSKMRFSSLKRLVVIFILVCVIFWVIILVYRPLIKPKAAAKLAQITYTKFSNIFNNSLSQKLLPGTIGLPNMTEKSEAEDGEEGVDFSRRALIFTENEESKMLKKLKFLLSLQNILVEVVTWNKLDDSFLSVPRLVDNAGLAKYSGFIFDNSYIYSSLDAFNRGILHDYCKKNDIGILLLGGQYNVGKESDYIQFGDFPLWAKYGVRGLYDTETNAKSSMLQITKAGKILECGLHKGDNTIFWSNHSSFEEVAYAFKDSDTYIKDNFDLRDFWNEEHSQPEKYRVDKLKMVTIMYDKGGYDGVRRVFFGPKIESLWQHKLFFLDALSILSRGYLGRPLKRWILIDIDDIFVARRGTRMKRDDVQAFIATQDRLATKIRNFRFNLGFSGFYFRNGSPEENEGDSMLLENSEKFWWFPHMYKHTKPHKQSYIQLEKEMRKNLEFAKRHGLVVNSSYSVSPHHSGVYPVHEELYEAWKNVWNVKVTSTEEYPHFYQHTRRRGFIHNGIMVLPRQICGLYTHTLYFKKFPRGRQRLEKNIRGGDLFMTIVNNPINIFMTHFGNYGSDRLAPYTFESVVNFISTWTNLELITEPPLTLANMYFDMFKDDNVPVWQDPCKDSRHLNIWSANKTCSRLPKFLIVGPQKTGTAALHSFLSINPRFVSNSLNRRSYEEVQFFNSVNYLKGLDWYMSAFPEKENTSDSFYFEKSANYFDSKVAFKRASILLPDAKIIVLTVDPARRAYSWYQHILSKNRTNLTGYSFYDVITDKIPTLAMNLFSRRCLFPGLYATHLEKWLSVYPPEQILVLDGDQLRQDPAAALDIINKFLGVEYFNYKEHIVFNRRKGFFCKLQRKIVKCLGHGKGRKYPSMDLRSEVFLRKYYRVHNLRFAQLLNKYKKPLPKWLKKEIEKL